MNATGNTPERGHGEPAAPGRAEDAPRRPAPARGPAWVIAVVLGIAAVVVALDQWTKHLALTHLNELEPVEVIGSFLRLTLLHNPGAAFSMGTSITPVITTVQVLIALAIVAVVIVRRPRSRAWTVTLGALLGGALGNITDRMVRAPGLGRGHVVDFIQLPHWPVFNVADSFVVCAAVALVLITMFGLHLDGTRDGAGNGKDRRPPAEQEPSGPVPADE